MKKKRKIDYGFNNTNAIYLHTTKSLDGKRQNINTCIYYDKTKGICNNPKSHTTYCLTSHNCTVYKRKLIQSQRRNKTRCFYYIKNKQQCIIKGHCETSSGCLYYKEKIFKS